MTPRIIIGISGASGFQYGVKALELLQPQAVEVHLVVSKGAEKTCELETDYRLDEVMALADVVHPINHLGASISSGSFKTLGMLVAPCSMRSLGAIAHCLTDNQYGGGYRDGRHHLSTGSGALSTPAKCR